MHTLQSDILKLSQATSRAALIAAVMLLALIFTSSTNQLSAQSLPTTLPINVPPSVANSNGALGVSYAAIFNPAEPTVSSEDTLENEQWQWSSNCYPTTGTGTVQASYTATLPGTYTSTVTCTVTWQAVNINTGQVDSTPTIQGSGSTVVNISTGGYTVAVNVSLNPSTTIPGETAYGSATASITGTTPSSVAELSAYNPQPTYQVVVQGKPKETLPSASIDPSTGQNLEVCASPSTTPDTYTVVVTATYNWNDSGGSSNGVSGSGTTQLTVVIPVVAINILNNQNVMLGNTIQGTIALISPKTLPASFSVGLLTGNPPPPSPQTTPPTPTATGAVTLPATVSVPGNGSAVSFSITGSETSAFVNDVYIYASGGATSNNASLTVWDWATPTCTVTTNGNSYVFSQSTATLYAPANGPQPVQMLASDTVMPEGAASLIPKTGSNVGLIQDECARQNTVNYSFQNIYWQPAATHNESISVPFTLTETFVVPGSIGKDRAGQ